MGFFHKYPYTDLNELNLDWVINMIRSLINQVENFVSLNAIKYADPIQWSIVTQYQKNTVVIDPLTGIAYISVTDVPQGVLLTDTNYWTVVFDLSSFVVKTARNFTDHYEAETTTTATINSAADDWIIWGDVLYHVDIPITIGTVYTIGTNLTKFTLEDYIGHLADLLTTDKTSIVNAINEIVNNVSTIFNNIGDVTQLITEDTSSIVAAINEAYLATGTNVITPQMFGAVADGVTDDLTAINAAINKCANTGKTLFFPPTTQSYKVSNSVVISSPNFDIIMDSPILYNGSGDGIVIEDAYRRSLKLSAISTNVTPYNNAGVKITNGNSCKIEIPYVNNFGTSVEFLGDDDACAYNYVLLNYLNNGYVGLLLTVNGAGYVNENMFVKGRIRVDSNKSYYHTNTAIKLLSYSGSNIIDHNIFDNTCVEGSGTGIYIEYGDNNEFRSIRNESVTKSIDLIRGFWNTYEFTDRDTYEDTITNSTPWNSNIKALMNNQALVYDSGLIAARSYSNASGTVLPPELYTLVSNVINPVIPQCVKYADRLECVNHTFVGIMINTSHCKRFTFTSPDDNSYMCIMCYDSNNTLLDETYPVKGAQRSTLENSTIWTTYNDTSYRYVILPDECDHAYIGYWIRHNNPIRGFKIYTDINPSTIKYGIPVPIKYHSNTLSSIPTCTGNDGDICFSSTGNEIGWKYYSGQWNVIS